MSRVLLFVDDDADVREAFADLLEFRGWTVAHAIDGEEAQQWLQANPPPAAIVLDLKMPRCDGYEFRRVQLQHPTWRTIPTVVFTADASVRKSELPSLGGAPVVRKSQEFGDLAKALDDATASE